jgi:hypothetical protein
MISHPNDCNVPAKSIIPVLSNTLINALFTSISCFFQCFGYDSAKLEKKNVFFRKNKINFGSNRRYLVGYNQPVVAFGNGIGAQRVDFLFCFSRLSGIQFVFGFTNRADRYQSFQVCLGKMGGEAAASGTGGVETGKIVSIGSIDDHSVSSITQRITCIAVGEVPGAIDPGRFTAAADGDGSVPDRDVGDDVVSAQFTGIFVAAPEIQE